MAHPAEGSALHGLPSHAKRGGLDQTALDDRVDSPLLREYLDLRAEAAVLADHGALLYVQHTLRGPQVLKADREGLPDFRGR